MKFIWLLLSLFLLAKILKQVKDAGIDKFLNEQLGSRGKAKAYSIADGLLSIHYSHLCGGSCIENINTPGEHIGFHPIANFE